MKESKQVNITKDGKKYRNKLYTLPSGLRDEVGQNLLSKERHLSRIGL